VRKGRRKTSKGIGEETDEKRITKWWRIKQAKKVKGGRSSEERPGVIKTCSGVSVEIIKVSRKGKVGGE